MTAAARAPGAGRPTGGFSDLLRRLLAVPEARHALSPEPAPLTDVPAPETLTFFLGRSNARGPLLSPSVVADDEVAVRQPLGTAGDVPVVPSPVPGRVDAVRQVPDVRGGRPGLAVLLKPSADGAEALPPLDARTVAADAVRERIRETGVGVSLPDAAASLVVLAADPEPGTTSALRQFTDDPDAAARAAGLLGRVIGAERAVVAVTEPSAVVAEAATNGTGVRVLSLPAEYPETLPEAVARREGRNGPRPVVVPLAEALAVLEAVEQGRAPATRVLTVVGPDGVAGNFRVAVGSRLGDVFAAAGLEPAPGDRIVTGGPFRGLAQYSLDAAVDLGVDALMLAPKGSFPDWSDEPCVSCGACLDVCPENLPAHDLSRYVEFGLVDRTPDLGLGDCIECGLCASVCPSRRPLLQQILLAKREVAAAARVLAEASGPPAPSEPDPIPVPVATAAKD